MPSRVPFRYEICPAKVPDLDRCWSACNGIEGFGHADEDREMIRARKRHGETLGLPCSPRIILLRHHKDDELYAKLWYTRTIDPDDDGILIMASLAKAIAHIDQDLAFEHEIYLDVQLFKYGEGLGYELDLEVCGEYRWLTEMKRLYRSFMKHFDNGSWS